MDEKAVATADRSGEPHRSSAPWQSRTGRSIGAGLLALAALTAHAQERPGPGPGPGPAGFGPGPDARPGGPPRPGMMPGGSPAHMLRSVDRLLDGIDATDAQRAQIRQIVSAAAGELKGQQESERGLRARGLQILAAPSVDANAAEALRQQMSAQHDQASRRMLKAMLDVAQVLTPEQRATIGRRIQDRENMMRDRMRRMQPPSAPPR